MSISNSQASLAYEQGWFDAYLGYPPMSDGYLYRAGYRKAKKEIARERSVVWSCYLGIILVFLFWIVWEAFR